MNTPDPIEELAELEDFIALLRDATPNEAWLDAVEAKIVVHAGAGAGASNGSVGGIAASAAKALVVLLAVAGLSVMGKTATVSDSRGHAPRASRPTIATDANGSFTPPLTGGARARREGAHPKPADDHPPARAAQATEAAQASPETTMAFGLDETAPDDASVAASESLALALRAYAAEDYLEAASALRVVVEGRSADSRQNVDKARFFLAKSLHHLGFDHGAAVVLEEIARAGEAGAYFDEALPWLAAVAERIPDDPVLVESVGRYDLETLERLEGADDRSRYDHLLYLMGRARYQDRRLREAIALFAGIDRDSPYWVPARFFTAVSHVRERKARPAVRAFRSVIEAIDSGAHGGVDDPERMRNLAWLSLGRVYYTAANRRDDEDRVEVDGRLLGAAIDAWDRIPESSEYWLDALFEASWAFFLAENHGRALGRIHALQSPEFTDAYYPEAEVVRAVILFSHCQLDAAEDVTGRFHRRYGSLLGALTRLAARRRDPARARALYAALQDGDAGLDPNVARLVRRTLGDRDLLRSVAHEAHVRAEATRAAALTSAPTTADLGSWLGQELAVVGALSADRAGELVSTRLDRLAEDLSERQNEMDAVELEINTQRRTGPPRGPGRDEVQIVADQEHMTWPFDGEYWRDELPYYRARVRNRCGR
jgi:tetratricopeptide (TPR) repeat protein